MKFQALLFDLDGTLINFDPNLFVKSYLGAASKFFFSLVPNPELFYQELLKSTDIMENSDNDTTTSLEDFLLDFCPKFDVDCEMISQRFLQFYQTDYSVVKPLIKQMDGALDLLKSISTNSLDTKIILATNPVFPYVAIEKRITWGGLSPDYFCLITHAENSYFCKFNRKYWLGIIDEIECNPEQSLVIGNDGIRDMGAKKYGFQTFLVEEAVENEEMITEDLEPDFRGSLKDLKKLLLS